MYSSGNANSVQFIHRDPHNTMDYTYSDTKWVGEMGTAGQAATSTYIAQYQAGMYGHPDPSFYAASSGQFYPGGGGNQKPGQSTVCYENYVKVDCNSLQMDIRNGGISKLTISSQSLTGYDEESSNLLSAANLATTSRNGQSTGKIQSRLRKLVIPGDNAKYTGAAIFDDGTRESLYNGGEQFDATAHYEIVNSSPGIELPVQLPTARKPVLDTRLPAQAKGVLPCVFNVNLNISGLSMAEVGQLEEGVWNIFRNAGHFVVFNNPRAARNTRRGSYTANVKPDNQFSRLIQRGLIGNFGVTPYYDITNPRTGSVIGRRTVNQGYISVTHHRNSTLRPFIDELATTVVHEDAHYILNSDETNDGYILDSGRSDSFSPAQLIALSKLCNPASR